MSEPLVIVTPELLSIARMTDQRIKHLESIGAIPCTLKEFLAYMGPMVDHYRGVLGNAEYDDQGRIVSFNKPLQDGWHYVEYFYRRVNGKMVNVTSVHNKVMYWITSGRDIVERGSKTTRHVYNNGAGHDSVGTQVWEGDELVSTTSFKVSTKGALTTRKEYRSSADGQVVATGITNSSMSHRGKLVTTTERDGVKFAKSVVVDGLLIYAFDCSLLGKAPHFETTTYDEKGRTVMLNTPMSTISYEYLEVNGKVVKVLSENNDRITIHFKRD